MCSRCHVYVHNLRILYCSDMHFGGVEIVDLHGRDEQDARRIDFLLSPSPFLIRGYRLLGSRPPPALLTTPPAPVSSISTK
jgi:hypothetical protein